ncbi:MAG: hypothetical protein ACRD0G_17215 [Acidimicrobiales bacterium]
MGLPERQRSSSPIPAVVGGLVAAVVLWWLAGIVIGTIVGLVRIAVLIALVAGGLWVWATISERREQRR